MTDVPTITRNTHNTLTTLLVPLTDRQLLLPNVAVAEITQCHTLEALPNTPAWLLGLFSWRDQKIPLLCFETLSSGAVVDFAKSQVLVMNAIGDFSAQQFFALLSQGIPRSIKVDQSLQSANMPLAAYELEAVQVAQGIAKIPDLLAIEQQLAALYGANV